MNLKANRSNILIVDDVAKNIQVVANILKSGNCNLYYSQSGEKALSIAANKDINLILLDVMMPGMDGFEVCRRLKDDDRTKHIPIIFLTAKADNDSIANGFEVGGVDYILKPFNPEELRARVKTHLSLREAYQHIEEQKSRLEELNATKDKFFSIIAHDLKNPFNSLTVLTEILKLKFNELSKDQIKQYINILFESSRNAYTLLDNLLLWSRSQREKLEFEPEELLLSTVIGENINLSNQLAKSKGIKLEHSVDSTLHVFADKNMLDTIFRNLITNAIKFTYEDGRIQIKANQQEEFIQISVQDTGIGIQPEIQKKIFKMESDFYTDGTRKEKGTGLGLVLCKEFIEKHEGEIWVESTPGEGSEFFFKLPVK